METLRRAIWAALGVSLALRALAQSGAPTPAQQQLREIYEELIEIDTTDSALNLRPYIHCDGFAGGVRGVALDRRPQTAEPWREVGFGNTSGRMSVVDGYRVAYSYPRTFHFANLKAERSDPSRYAEDKRIVTLNLADMARADGNTALAGFSDRGFLGPDAGEKGIERND